MKLHLKLLVSLVVVLCPVVSFADQISVDDMKKTCLEGFMKDADQSTDPDAYKSYANKMCECASDKIGGKAVDQNAVIVAMGSCIGSTLLTETMDNVKGEESLTADKITSTCTKEWQVFTSFKKNQGTMEKTCACAAKEIMSLPEESRTDDASLAKIAMTCAGKDA